MTEKTNSFENMRVPTEGEVRRLIEGIIGEKPYTEIVRREDENGRVCRLVVEVSGDDGDPVRYDYIRAGKFTEDNSSETAIDIIYLNSYGDVVGGDCAAKFVDGNWQTQNALPNVLETSELHEDDIQNSEGMRILLARKYNLPETATHDEILEAEEALHLRKVASLLGLPEDSDFNTLEQAALEQGHSFSDVSNWVTHGVGLNPTRQEFELAVLNIRQAREELLLEANIINKTLNGG